jgi:hypothetical protein
VENGYSVEMEEVFLGVDKWVGEGCAGVLCMFFLFYFGCLHKCEIYVCLCM